MNKGILLTIEQINLRQVMKQMNDRKLWETLNKMYEDLKIESDGLEAYKNKLHAQISMYFINNPDVKVRISVREYRRLHDGGIHSWSPWDWIGDVMVAKKMQRYIKWVD